MNARPILIALLAGCAGSACASSSRSSPGQPAALRTVEPPVVAADRSAPGEVTCRDTFRRMRTCTAQWIPALVDLRVRHDVPAGIADTDRRIGRAALVRTAMDEWAHDSTDEAIAATCRRLVGALAPDDGERVTAASERCLADAGCDGFTACISPVVEAHLVPPGARARTP